MRVAHEHQRKSAEKWMGCRGTLEMNPGQRQYSTNPKRDEELEDVNDEDEEDMYFEFETSPKPSKCNKTIVNGFVILFFTVLSIRSR